MVTEIIIVFKIKSKVVRGGGTAVITEEAPSRVEILEKQIVQPWPNGK